MILDTLNRSHHYTDLHPSFPVAFEWLKAFDPAMSDGRYEIGGPDIAAIVQRYETAPSHEKKWETHRVHGDIQYIVSGSEGVGHDRRENLTVRLPYNPEKDAEFYEPPIELASQLHLAAGTFAIFLPHDAHQPGVMIGRPGPVLKVVIKFRL